MASREQRYESRGQMGLGFSIEEITRVPQSNWVAPDPSTWPDRLVGDIGIDTETHDLGLNAKQGAGWAWRGGGEVVGYSITADNFSAYLPVGHEGGGNLDRNQVRRYLNHVLADTKQRKIFANAGYDIPWAENDGVKIAGPVIDIQMTEALLDEYRRSYSLENIAQDRLGRGKNEAMLADAAKAFGYDPKGELWRLHAKFVGPYAIEDSSLPRDIWNVHKPLIEKEGLTRICDLEHALLPMYADMRRRGVRVDLDRVDQLKTRFREDVQHEIAQIKDSTGIDVALWEPQSVARVLDYVGIKYDVTAKTRQPSIKNELLKATDHWIAKALLRAREKDKLIGTFLDGQLLGKCHDGRVHGSINPLKSDDGGTVTGRISMSDPNLMFIPARTAEGKLIRACLIPEEGEEWISVDYSQQEVRLLVHFAIVASRYVKFPRELRERLATAVEAQRRYLEDPNLNYHKFVAEITALAYSMAKGLNFAIIYGRGIEETSRALGISYDEAKRLFSQHREKMPFARAMADAAQRIVRERGYITTLLGRRQRFPFWEPDDWNKRTDRLLHEQEARMMWPNQKLVRARIHKALNSVVQPSAADQMKKAMLDIWNAGYGGSVLIQVHDELNLSTGSRKIANNVAEIMRSTVELEVPVLTDIAYGKNWGEAT